MSTANLGNMLLAHKTITGALPPLLQEQMRQAIRKRHRNYLVGFLVIVFFILVICFCAFRQPEIAWR